MKREPILEWSVERQAFIYFAEFGANLPVDIAKKLSLMGEKIEFSFWNDDMRSRYRWIAGDEFVSHYTTFSKSPTALTDYFHND